MDTLTKYNRNIYVCQIRSAPGGAHCSTLYVTIEVLIVLVRDIFSNSRYRSTQNQNASVRLKTMLPTTSLSVSANKDITATNHHEDYTTTCAIIGDSVSFASSKIKKFDITTFICINRTTVIVRQREISIHLETQ